MNDAFIEAFISSFMRMGSGRPTFAVSASKSERQLDKFDDFLRQFEGFLHGESVRSLMEKYYQQMIRACEALENFFGSMQELDMTESELHKYRERVGDRLAESRKLVKFLCRIVTELYEKEDEKSAKLVRLLLGIFLNSTFVSDDFCVLLSGVEFFHEDFVQPALKTWREKFKTAERVKDFVKGVLGCLFNMFYKGNLRAVINLSEFDYAELARPYLIESPSDVSLRALIVIVFSAEENDADVFDGATDAMRLLVEQLNGAVGTPGRVCNGFHVIESANIVRRLSLTDSNKRLLVKDLKLLPVLERLLTGEKDDEKSVAIDILFSLSFNEENCLEILQQLKGAINSLGQNLKWRMSRSFQGLVMKLMKMREAAEAKKAIQVPQVTEEEKRKQEKEEEKVTQEKQPAGQHVMISYEHSDTQTVLAIREALKAAGIQVWIDKEQMSHGHTYELLAEAVDSAYAIVICMSEKYMNSDMCKREATYASQQKKRLVPVLLQQKYKPTGWLGFMLAADLYIDLSGKYPLEQKMPDLVKTLQNHK